MVAIERHLWVIRGMLDDDEEQLTWIKARRQAKKHEGALALTPRRVVFVGVGSFGSSAESFPFPLLGAARAEGTALYLQVAGVTETFVGRKPEDVAEFLTALDTARGGAGAIDEATTLIDQLAKLDALHASGALSDDEFAQAKARLLS